MPLEAKKFRQAIAESTLRSCQLFMGLPATDIAAIASFIVAKHLTKGDYLFRQSGQTISRLGEFCMAKYRIGWLPGDGIGIEVLEAAKIVLDKIAFNAEAAKDSAGTQTAESVLECFLNPERFDRDIRSAIGQAFYFRNHIDFVLIENHIGAHLARHRCSCRIALDSNNQRRSHQFRACCGAEADWSLRENDNRIA